MRKYIFLSTASILMMLSTQKAHAYDFSAVNSGQTIYYNITSANPPLTVEVANSNGGYNYSGTIVIPGSVIYSGNTYSVTAIGDYAFSYSYLTSITIPNSVTTIGDWAFSKSSGLTSIIIDSSVTTIGTGAFTDCGLTSIIIGNSVTTIGDGAFSMCMGLTSVTIGNSVMTIGDNAFDYCRSLITIAVDAGNPYYSSDSGVLFNKSKTTLLKCPDTKKGSYTIPNTVTTIGNYAFSNCDSLTSVIIPNSVIAIGNNAFASCVGLTSVTIPNSVASIGNDAFSYCNGLTSITIPSSVTNIGNYAFARCAYLTTVNFNATNCISMGTTLNSPVFNGCQALTTLNIGNQVKIIPDYAFSNCDNLTGRLIIPDSVTTIGNYAFASCYGFTSVTIPNSVTSIGDGGFSNCVGFTSVTIPSSVTSIGDYAFLACSGLTDIYAKAVNPPLLGYDAFYKVIANLHVPCGRDTVYRASAWGIFNNNTTADVSPLNVSVQSNDYTMGSAVVTIVNPCTNAMAAIVAVPNAGYRFVQWNNGDTNSSFTIMVTQDTSFTAIFDLATGTFNVSVTANNINMGSVTGNGNYAANSTTTISATPNIGYRFVQWNDGITDNPRTITVTQDTIFTAEFAVSTQGMFHITITVNDANMGTVFGGGDFEENTALTFVATAQTGYRFVQWNDGNTDNPRAIILTQDTAFVAIFDVDIQGTFKVSVTANNINMGSVTGNGNYTANTTITISAIANSGYRFVQWNDGNTDNPRTVTVTQDTAFTAEFTVSQTLFYVFVTANQTGMGTVFGSGDYAKDTTITIGAIANSNYRFVQWNDGITQNPRTIKVTQDSIFTAEFAVATPGMYHVSLTVNSATMGSVAGSGDYGVNTIATIGAIANTGYRFVQWNDGNTENPRAITVTQDTSFIATLEPIIYNVSLNSNDTVRGITNGSGDYVAFSVVTITATPNAGYRFVGWSDNNKDSMRAITITQNLAFVAIFGIEDMYYVYAAPQNSTMGNVTGSDDYHKRNNAENSPIFKREYAANSIASIVATPNADYRFVQWDDGNTDNPREFTVTGDSIFTAIFESTVGISNVAASAISVYPNPVTDNIHIVLPENVVHAVFTLYDMQGKVLIRQQVSNRDAVSVSNLANGIYIYNVGTEKEKRQGKIVKQ